ncbi:MAG: hypothetical protein WD013_00365 [Gemmatimonadota bacterium]
MKLPGSLLATLAVALLLAALSLVTWRQSRALDELAELDHLRREISLMSAERNELGRRIQTLESRGYVVPAARERLDMRAPRAAEIVLLPGTVTSDGEEAGR